MLALGFLLVLPGCGKNKAVYRAYEDAKSAALSDPGPAPPNWKPDVKVHLSSKLLDEVLTAVLERRKEITGEVKVPGVQLTPTAVIESLVLSESQACPTCMAIDLDLSGDMVWNAGLLGSGTVDYTASVAFDSEFDTQKDGDTWTVWAKPRDVRSVDVRVSGWSGAVKNIAEAPLKKWLDDNVVSKIEPIEVSSFDTAGVPLRGARVRPVGKGLVVEMLSSAPNPGQLGPDDGKPGMGFMALVATDTVVRFAAAESFKAGPMDYDLVAEPRGLAVNKETFALDLRLWKVGGAGWWRDYSIAGKVGVRNDQVKLKAENVTEGEKSKGAALADPLFFLGEGIVAREMEKAIKVSVPNVMKQQAGGLRTVTHLNAVDGDGTVMKVSGTIELVNRMDRSKIKAKGKGKR
ncbi:MAG: hypothetical protein R3F61_16930 [Myxococcota bacterium]